MGSTAIFIVHTSPASGLGIDKLRRLGSYYQDMIRRLSQKELNEFLSAADQEALLKENEQEREGRIFRRLTKLGQHTKEQPATEMTDQQLDFLQNSLQQYHQSVDEPEQSK